MSRLHLEHVHTLLEVVFLPLGQGAVVMDTHPKHLAELLL